ncbi:MAG: ComF family protein [Oscillospiraceae bacterium]|nr:ComF family protein [Oscillospiraceae bacterium]MBQ3050057.1 ComF family protein [Oscillospiraceae bacterium]MBQ9938812.1 ComF family protein [Oscillospiraceae bacterium]
MEKTSFSKFWKIFWDSVFPNKCAACGKLLYADGMICNDCEHLLGIIGENCCEKCGKPPEDCICGRYTQHYEACVSAVELYEAGKTIVYDFKFKYMTTLKQYMAPLMADALMLRFGEVQFDHIVGVPMRWRAVLKRGYNQSELLAKELAECLGQNYTKGLLVKLRKTKHQASLNAKERLTNLTGAIGIAENADIKGKHILVVDDIITTGATVNECAKVLKENGAASVCCVSFATTVRENV